MWLVAGLGNPGSRYAGTRHNAGFMVVGELSRRWGVPLRPGVGPEELGRGRVGESGEEVLLLRPLSFMNRVGPVVARRAAAEAVPPENLLVIVDDIELPLGTIRFRPRGSSGGHNGLRSLIAALQTEGFPRLRVGIGRPPREGESGEDVVDHVLSTFEAEERPLLAKALAAAAGLAEKTVTTGGSSPVTVTLDAGP